MNWHSGVGNWAVRSARLKQCVKMPAHTPMGKNMPRLKSGRHVAITVHGLMDAISYGTTESVSYAILALRLLAVDPASLREPAPVLYFRNGGPVDGEAYHSGFNVRDVLAGKAGWPEDEIQEFRDWLDSDGATKWFQSEHRRLNEAASASPVWETDFWNDNPDPNPTKQ